MIKIDLGSFEGLNVGENVSIEGENVTILPGTRIEDNVSIAAKNIYIGNDSVIEKETKIKGLGSQMSNFYLGDNAFIGFRNQILVPDFRMGDYSQLHNSGLNSGYKKLTIGHNCWIGQNSILNSTQDLIIENNVRIGTQSQLWTHAASGELLEGCTLFTEAPLVLKDNVWIVGGAVISPGLTLEKSSIIMTGAVLTKSTIEGHTYAGLPAKDVTEKMNFWKRVSISDKLEMIRNFSKTFKNLNPQYSDKIFILNDDSDISKYDRRDVILIVPEVKDFSVIENTKASIFDLSSKFYIKRRTKIEIDFIKYNLGYRARFIPYFY